MPILNYTTKIDPQKTVGEIQAILARHEALQIMLDYQAGHISAVSFTIDTPGGVRGVRLPANVDGVQRALAQQKVKVDRDQAERVAWRIVKDWLEAQMAILEAQMVDLDEIFLPYLVDRDGRTFFQAYRANLRIEAPAP